MDIQEREMNGIEVHGGKETINKKSVKKYPLHKIFFFNALHLNEQCRERSTNETRIGPGVPGFTRRGTTWPRAFGNSATVYRELPMIVTLKVAR